MFLKKLGMVMGFPRKVLEIKHVVYVQRHVGAIVLEE